MRPHLTRRHALISGAASLALMGNIKSPSVATPEFGETGRVARIIDGDSFVLALESGEELSVRLSAIQAPRTAQRAAQAWPYASEALRLSRLWGISNHLPSLRLNLERQAALPAL